MDASTIFLAALILHFSLSVAANGQFDGTQDLVLPGSVFQIFRRTTLQQCRRLCVYTSRCLSVNWSSSTRECQLKSKKGNRKRLLVSDSSNYLLVQQMKQQAHPCSSQPCSTNHMCIPVNTAKDHVCVRVGAFTPTPTTVTTTPGTTPAPATATATPGTTRAPTTATATPGTTPTPTTATTTPGTTPAPTPSAPESTSTTTKANTAYNGTCVTDIDCAVPPGRTCSGGVCICSIGYDMDETSVECRRLTECSSFGSGFILYVDKVIKGYAVYKSNTTSADCARLCLNATSTCRSFEMQDTVCSLQAVTWFSVPNHKRVSFQGVNHYQRRCAW